MIKVLLKLFRQLFRQPMPVPGFEWEIREGKEERVHYHSSHPEKSPAEANIVLRH